MEERRKLLLVRLLIGAMDIAPKHTLQCPSHHGMLCINEFEFDLQDEFRELHGGRETESYLQGDE